MRTAVIAFGLTAFCVERISSIDSGFGVGIATSVLALSNNSPVSSPLLSRLICPPAGTGVSLVILNLLSALPLRIKEWPPAPKPRGCSARLRPIPWLSADAALKLCLVPVAIRDKERSRRRARRCVGHSDQ